MLVSISEERGDFSNLLVTAYISKLYDIFMLIPSQEEEFYKKGNVRLAP